VRIWLAIVVVAGCSSSQPSEKEPQAPAAPVAAPAIDAAIVDGVAADAPVDAPAVAIVDAPMAWSAERERLTLDYRRQHSDEAATDLAIEPAVIVLHYTGGGSAKATRGYFDNTTIEASRQALARAGKVNVSAHFVVDRDGTIYQLQPVTRFARHCIGLNHIAIGIENAGDEAKYPLTEAQVTADAALIRQLASQHKITHLLGHHEVMGMRDSALYVERDPRYKNDKGDPGKAFMAKVRERVADLKLSGP
jgi:N-acetyl-anhydromuramyl-L-alanine amidase AmpD